MFEKNLYIYQRYYEELRHDYINKNRTQDIDCKNLQRKTEMVREDIIFAKKQLDDKTGEQLYFYVSKFQNLENLLKENKKAKSKNLLLNNEAKKLFSEEKYISPDLMRSNYLLNSFFVKKKQRRSQYSFAKIFQSSTNNSKLYQKKIESNLKEIERLKRENLVLENQLRTMLIMGALGINQKQRIHQIQQKIVRLEEQNQRFYQQNRRIKTEYRQSTCNNKKNISVDEVITSPYSLQTRENNLNIIDNWYMPQNLLLKPKASYQYSSVKDDDNLDHESIYKMSQYSQSINWDLQQIGIYNDKFAGRNKIAFFKKEGILFRDQFIDIAYKKSYPGTQLQKIILNIYINNKSSKTQKVNIQYDYERTYYKLEVSSKIYEVQKFKQSREVVEIQLNHQKQDINSISEGIIHVAGKDYKFWLPVIFVQFKKYSEYKTFSFRSVFTKHSSKLVKVNSVFRTPEQMKKRVPMLEYEETKGVLWGISKFCQGPIYLSWKGQDRVHIKTYDKWMLAISFALINFE